MNNKRFHVPNFRELFMPILKEIDKDQPTRKQVRNAVAISAGVPKKKTKVALPDGTENTFEANFDLAFEWLLKKELIERTPRTESRHPENGKPRHVLTEQGRISLVFGELPDLPQKMKTRDLAKERARRQKVRTGTALNDPTPAAERERKRRENARSAEGHIVDRIPDFPPDKLFKLWLENVKRLGNNGKKDLRPAARTIVRAIEKEWDRRLPMIRRDPECFAWPSTEAHTGGGAFGIDGSPDQGMLAYLEYHVGRTKGQPEGLRRVILDRIVKGTLPLYGGLE